MLSTEQHIYLNGRFQEMKEQARRTRDLSLLEELAVAHEDIISVDLSLAKTYADLKQSTVQLLRLDPEIK